MIAIWKLLKVHREAALCVVCCPTHYGHVIYTGQVHTKLGTLSLSRLCMIMILIKISQTSNIQSGHSVDKSQLFFGHR